VVVLALAAFGISRLIPGESLIVSLGLKAALVLAVITLSVAVGALDRRDLRRILTLLHERLARLRRTAADTTA
jgi:hypothetical protein